MPLSPYSTTFYNEWKLCPDRSDYNLVFDQSLSGTLNISKLNYVIKRFISDYIIFNSHIENENDNLYWVKNNKIHQIEFFEQKLSNKEILSYIQNAFNLETGPLYRFRLIKEGDNNYRLIIVLHHIIIAGLSFDNFIRELSNYYNNKFYKSSIFEEEQSLRITKLSKELLGYVNFNKEESKSFWKESLLNTEVIDLRFLKLSTNNLPSNSTKRDVPLQALSNIGEIRFSFDKEILLKLNQLRIIFEITPYLYSQSIYSILLNKYTGQDKFCINYPIAIKEGTDFIYGAHINTIVNLYDFGKINNILDIINESKKFIKSLKQNNINHTYLPISDIASVSNKEILNVSFIQTNLKDKVFEFDNIKSKVNFDTNIDLLNDLLFEQAIRNEAIHHRIRYKSDKINITLLQEFINSYKKIFLEVLDELVSKNIDNKLTHIRDYNILSKKQYEQIINIWNQTDKEYPADKTIHRLFEEQVERTPDSIAIVYEDKKLTYKELNTRANQLANYIKQNYDITPDTLIASNSKYGLKAINQ